MLVHRKLKKKDIKVIKEYVSVQKSNSPLEKKISKF